jgi:hypothetical protein
MPSTQKEANESGSPSKNNGGNKGDKKNSGKN